jgi:hypothetical protein
MHKGHEFCENILTLLSLVSNNLWPTCLRKEKNAKSEMWPNKSALAIGLMFLGVYTFE